MKKKFKDLKQGEQFTCDTLPKLLLKCVCGNAAESIPPAATLFTFDPEEEVDAIEPTK